MSIVDRLPGAIAVLVGASACSGDPASSPKGPDASVADASEGRDSATPDAAPDVETMDASVADGNDGPCAIQHTQATAAGAAASAGFTGTSADYDALFGSACQLASDCMTACTSAGGSMSSCADGSECAAGAAADGGVGCLPPTYWSNTAGALSASGLTASAASLVLVSNPYDDALVLTNFGISIPDASVVMGIQFEVDRATLDGNGVDDSVRVLQAGAPVGTEHGLADPWPIQLKDATYGSADDLWGTSWAPSDIRSSGFGVSIAPRYTGPSNANDRAYIDAVRVTVFYRMECE
jgi:hypothetical protein